MSGMKKRGFWDLNWSLVTGQGKSTNSTLSSSCHTTSNRPRLIRNLGRAEKVGKYANWLMLVLKDCCPRDCLPINSWPDLRFIDVFLGEMSFARELEYVKIAKYFPSKFFPDAQCSWIHCFWLWLVIADVSCVRTDNYWRRQTRPSEQIIKNLFDVRFDGIFNCSRYHFITCKQSAAQRCIPS